MYLERVMVKGYGSIKDLDLIPQFNENGSPKPIVIVGKNGSGKTLLLSQMVDSLIELKRKKYTSITEVETNNYYKTGKKNYINIEANDSLVEVTYRENDKLFKYIDFMSNNIAESARLHESYEYFPMIYTDDRYKEIGYYKSIIGSNVENELENNIISYFPVHRYHVPAWYNKSNKQIGFQFTENNLGFDNNSLIKENVLNEVEGWLLDVLLDMYLYESKVNKVLIHVNDNQFRNGLEMVQINGRNTILKNLINRILTVIYQVKYKNIESARIGVTQKAGRRISIILKETGDNEREIAPTFSHLSSGEAMLLSLFASILKSYDNLDESQHIHSLGDVKGIVIIDEIDLNLHIEFARNIIPELIELFPNVQFIITTHSPFMLLGMEEQFKEKWQLINLPNGEEISVDDFSEVKEAYEIFVNGYEGLKDEHRQLVDRIKQDTKTLIITEGKTDWKHLKNAYNKLKLETEFNQFDLEFLEYDETMLQMSDSQLNTLLRELAKVNQNKKIIGIFDSDEANGKKYAKERRHNLGNNVFAFSIPKPNFRSEYEGISIELLYRDVNIKTEDENGRRLFLTSEFSTISGRHLEDKILTYSGDAHKLRNPKIIDCDVYNADDENVALSKNQFAEYILNQQENFIDFDLSGFYEVFRVIKEIEEL
ncbi:AAA family ATPase [Peribacillus sp. NPDC056705]|uniref:AAA family ATPase n=1 Tax=Peribacillus sp. NPDC056705 TaxID=3345918 RepID=UPI0037486376